MLSSVLAKEGPQKIDPGLVKKALACLKQLASDMAQAAGETEGLSSSRAGSEPTSGPLWAARRLLRDHHLPRPIPQVSFGASESLSSTPSSKFSQPVA